MANSLTRIQLACWTERLTRLVREMSTQTQFIINTHSKTIEAAQATYGVTMQEPGVSKLV